MKKNKVIVISLIIIGIILIVGVSYAVFQKTIAQEGINEITTYSCLNITFESLNNVINIDNAYPIKDEEGLRQTPYKFTINNTCDKYVAVDLGIKLTSSLSVNRIKVALNKLYEEGIPTLLSNATNIEDTDNYIVLNDGINANGSQSYEYRMWMDEATSFEEGSGAEISAEIIAVATVKTEEPHGWSNAKEGGLLYALRKNNTVTEPLTTPGQEISLETESVLSSAPDDYGTSYYFRGNVQNNYLVFAGMCWRIVRVTGDGSIKLILHNNDGTNCNISDNTLNFAKYDGTHYTSAYNDETYIKVDETTGYVSQTPAGSDFMYGNMEPAGETDEEKYLDLHSNLHDSTILKKLKQWYALKSTFTTKEKYLLADVIWCNDKSLHTGNGWASNVNTTFKTTQRIITDKLPLLSCSDINENENLSKYTAYDTINGNGALNKYKIGLLTADEAAYAGNIYDMENNSNYLMNGYDYWLLSPYHYIVDGNASSLFAIAKTKKLIYAWTLINGNNLYIRPSIALISNVKITNTNQTGTINNPYVIQE